MVQFLDRIQKNPSLGERFAQAFSNMGQQTPGVAQELLNRSKSKEEAEAIKRLTGEDVSGLSPELRKDYFKNLTSGQMNKQQEKAMALETGLGTIQKMRELISSAGPSNYIKGLLGGETTKNRAELEALGRSLIPLVAAGVPIRNQKEFEEYRKVITNPNSRQAELEGALNGIQNILERSITGTEESTKKKMKFSATNPEHRKKAEQLHKTYKDKEKVREALSKEFEF